MHRGINKKEVHLMLKIKKYANGRYYDTVNKKYIKADQLAAMMKKGKKVSVTLSKTGKDITKTVSSQLLKKGKKKEDTFLKPDNIKKWFGDNIDLDKQINRVLNMMNLPTKAQITKLNSSVKALNKKVSDLEKLQTKKISAMEKAFNKANEKMNKKLDQQSG
jgi:polyhydroxyalkanoate synthesis regulator protein